MQPGGPTFCFIVGGAIYGFITCCLPCCLVCFSACDEDPEIKLAKNVEGLVGVGTNQFQSFALDLGMIAFLLILLGGAQVEYHLTVRIVFFCGIVPMILYPFFLISDRVTEVFAGIFGVAADGESKTYKLTSVYVDPHKTFSSLFFKIFVPQIISIVLYMMEVRQEQPGWNTQERWYAFMGVLFVPVFYLSATDFLPSMSCAVALHAVARNKKLSLTSEEKKIPMPSKVTFQREGGWGPGGDDTMVVDDAWLFEHFTGPRFYLMVFFYMLVNCVFPMILYLSVPVFLARSDGRITFVLNAMAMLFVLQLDDLGSAGRGSEISVTFDYSDEENPGASQLDSNEEDLDAPKPDDKPADLGPGKRPDALGEVDASVAVVSVAKEA